LAELGEGEGVCGGGGVGGEEGEGFELAGGAVKGGADSADLATVSDRAEGEGGGHDAEQSGGGGGVHDVSDDDLGSAEDAAVAQAEGDAA